MEQIFLKNKKSKTSVKDNSFLNVSFKTNKMLLPSTSIESILNQEEQYNEERNKCNIIRLVCTINPFCSNVLFNTLTEVIYDEGSNYPIPMNYITTHVPKKDLVEGSVLPTSKVIYSLNFNDTTKEKTYIQDTQLSRFDRLTYHCGWDIFNNHLIRSNTYKGVTVPKSSADLNNQTSVFNTIRDYLRDYHGVNKLGYNDLLYTNSNIQLDAKAETKMHIYLDDDIDSFMTAQEKKLHEKNGWFGFVNTPQITTYDKDGNAININKPINNEASCGFVDMYPERELFYFTPLYNKEKHKIEKNWNYCITYPSSSTTKGISFINSVDDLNSLKIAVYDDNVNNSNGIESIYICSTCKHGLVKGDIINLYLTIGNNNSLVYDGAFVNEIVDDYTFYITKNGNILSENWMDLDTFVEENTKTVPDRILSDFYRQITKYVYECSTARPTPYYCPVVNNKINLYQYNQNFSFKKVVNSVECDYYVRIFSKIPNWKFADVKPTEYEMYKEGSDLIKRYQKLDSELESHVGKLAFANNVYGDDVSEIVFTDDIDISNLKDNLNRPLTNLYLTILKNNRGYKDWYKNGIARTINDFDFTKTHSLTDYILHENDTIEYSHCFGKLINNFNLSYESLINPNLSNIKRCNNIEETAESQFCSNGLDYSLINENRPNSYENDEVVYDYYDIKNADEKYKTHELGDINFYGDVVCFSPSEFLETTLQMSDFRINTAQRELKANDNFLSQTNQHGEMFYDEILYDDYDYNSSNKDKPKQPFQCETYQTGDCRHKEGYFYQGHYEIPIKTFSNTLNMQQPKFYNPVSINIIEDEGEKIYIIKTMQKTYLEAFDKFVLYDVTLSDDSSKKEEDKYHYMVVSKIQDRRIIYATVMNETTKDEFKLNNTVTHKFKLFKPDETIPDYAFLLKDKTFNYVWRDVLQNGTDDESENEVYPFTNNALYVNKFINFYLKRQDPNNYVKDYAWDGCTIKSMNYPYDIDMKIMDDDEENNYFEEDEIVC